jgi:hypothetical protein
MDVQEFVSSTILQIMEGVASSQARARELGGYINPTPHHASNSSSHTGVTATGHPIYPIEFDIALSVSGEAGVEAGARLHVASIVSIGGKGSSKDKTESVSRVKFAVNVTMPVDAESTAEREERLARDSDKLVNRRRQISEGATPRSW